VPTRYYYKYFTLFYPWNGEWDLVNQFVEKKYVLEVPCTNRIDSTEITISQTSGPENFSKLTPGEYIIEYEARDQCGNIDSCSFQISILETQDTTNLIISCPNDQILETSSDSISVLLDWTDPVASSNCPEGNIFIKQTAGNFKFDIVGPGNYPITYEITDDCGNVEICSFVINVIPEQLPDTNGITLKCLEDIIVKIPVDQDSVAVSWTLPAAETNCTIPGDENNCSTEALSGYTFLGKYAGNLYFKSNNPLSFPLALAEAEREGGHLVKIDSPEENEFIRQNLGSDLCLIGLNDQVAEGLFQWTDGTSPEYLNFKDGLNNDLENNYGVINFWNGEWELTTDYIYKKYILEIPCSPVEEPAAITLVQNHGPASGSNFSPGTTLIAYTVKDACGNLDSCTFKVIVDQEIPTNEPPAVLISTPLDTVNSDFAVQISFSEAVDSLKGSDLIISNGSWYDFFRQSDSSFSIIISPLNEGMVALSIPENIAFDQDSAGNLPSNQLNISYLLYGDDPSPNGSCLVKPTGVTLLQGSTAGGTLISIINGDGLTEQNDLNASHGGGTLYEGGWLNDGTDPVIEFDLGALKSIDGIALWNYSYHNWFVLKRRGVRDFHISTSGDGSDFRSAVTFTAGQTAPRGEKEKAQVFNFPPVTARYIRMEVINPIDDNLYVGLGEVRFTNNCSPPADLRNTSGNFSRKEEIAPTLFPNPTNAKTYLTLNSMDGTVCLDIIDEYGRIIKSDRGINSTGKDQIKIDLSDAPDGLYFIRISMAGRSAIFRKVIKTNDR